MGCIVLIANNNDDLGLQSEAITRPPHQTTAVQLEEIFSGSKIFKRTHVDIDAFVLMWALFCRQKDQPLGNGQTA